MLYLITHIIWDLFMFFISFDIFFLKMLIFLCCLEGRLKKLIKTREQNKISLGEKIY